MVQDLFWSCASLLTRFWSPNGPFSRLFGTVEGPKWLEMGRKWAHSIVCAPQMVHDHVLVPKFNWRNNTWLYNRAVKYA